MFPLSLFLICVYVGGEGGLRPCAHMCVYKLTYFGPDCSDVQCILTEGHGQ